jgi:hypothetical protein
MDNLTIPLIKRRNTNHIFKERSLNNGKDNNLNETDFELNSVSKKTTPKSLIDQKVSHINMRTSRI